MPVQLLPGIPVQGSFLATDPTPGADKKVGPKTLAGKSPEQLKAIAEDNKGQFDIHTQLAAIKELVKDSKAGGKKGQLAKASLQTLDVKFTNSDLKGLGPDVLGYLSVTGSPSLKNAITPPPDKLDGMLNEARIEFDKGVNDATGATTGLRSTLGPHNKAISTATKDNPASI